MPKYSQYKMPATNDSYVSAAHCTILGPTFMKLTGENKLLKTSKTKLA